MRMRVPTPFAVAGTGAAEVTAGAVGGDGDAGDGTPDGLIIRLNAAMTMIEIEQNGMVQSLPAGSPLVINGSGDDDTLTIDYINGNPIPASGLVFNGGGQGGGGDTLVITGGTHTSATYNYLNANDGSHDGGV